MLQQKLLDGKVKLKGVTNNALWPNLLGFILDISTTYIYSLSAKSTFKITNLGGHVSESFFKLLNKDNKQCKQNSTVNLSVV